MIRQLHEPDRASLFALLNQAPEVNLYLLGNVEANGFDQDFCEFWGDIADGRIRGVINRYMTGWSVYGEPSADWAGLAAIMDNYPVTAERLQDNPWGIESFVPYLKNYTIDTQSEETLMQLAAGAFQPHPPLPGFTVRRATLDDLPALVNFFADAGSMARTPAAIERPLRDRRIWIATQQGANDPVLAAALTNAETSTLAMIGGVYTDPAWRGQGLSQSVCSALCAELLQTNRRPVLYWDNPAAGHVYCKLGFGPIGTWRSVRLARR